MINGTWPLLLLMEEIVSCSYGRTAIRAIINNEFYAWIVYEFFRSTAGADLENVARVSTSLGLPELSAKDAQTEHYAA